MRSELKKIEDVREPSLHIVIIQAINVRIDCTSYIQCTGSVTKPVENGSNASFFTVKYGSC